MARKRRRCGQREVVEERAEFAEEFVLRTVITSATSKHVSLLLLASIRHVQKQASAAAAAQKHWLRVFFTSAHGGSFSRRTAADRCWSTAFLTSTRVEQLLLVLTASIVEVPQNQLIFNIFSIDLRLGLGSRFGIDFETFFCLIPG